MEPTFDETQNPNGGRNASSGEPTSLPDRDPRASTWAPPVWDAPVGPPITSNDQPSNTQFAQGPFAQAPVPQAPIAQAPVVQNPIAQTTQAPVAQPVLAQTPNVQGALAFSGAPGPATTQPGATTFTFVPKRPIAERYSLVGAVPKLVLAFAAAGGLLFDLTIRAGGQAGLGWALFFGIMTVGLAVAGRSKRSQTMVEAGNTSANSVLGGIDPKFLLVLPFLIVLMIRRSPWVVWVDLASLFSLLAILAASPLPADKNDFSFGAIAYRVVKLFSAPIHGFLGVAGSLKTLSGSQGTGIPKVSRRLVVSVLVAIPIVGAVAGLLASADALFASIFAMPDLGSFPAHLALFSIGAVAIAGYIVSSRKDRWSNVSTIRMWFTKNAYLTEVNVLVGGLAGVLALFGVVQIVAIAQGAAYIERKTGLTYAEYARQGFFQLLAVVCIVFVVLGLGRSLLLIPDDTETTEKSLPASFRMLAVLASILTIAIVGVSIRRLSLYNDAYGHTMLRLSSTIFAAWLGLCMAMVGLTVAGFRRSTYWLPKAVFISALVFSVGYSAMNPEARVASWNIANATRSTQSETSQSQASQSQASQSQASRSSTSGLDQDYFNHLSDDATPTIVRHLGANVVLDRYTASPCKDESFWTWNLAAQRARSAACADS